MHAQQPHTEADRRVGVIIPVYNRAATLIRTLAAVLKQSLPPARLIVVDDGSTDGTPDRVEGWLAAAAPPFEWRVVRAAHRGAAAARTTGMEELGGLPLAAFLDSDDHWPADFLERTTAALAADPLAVAVSADRVYHDAAGRVYQRDDCRALADEPVEWMFFNGGGVASCTLFRTEAVRRAGPWPAHLEAAEDLKLFVEVALLGRWRHAPGAAVEFDHGAAAVRGEEGNLSRRHADRDSRWACVYEQIYAELWDRGERVDYGRLAAAVAMVWGRAGKQLLQLGRADEARDALLRAVRWKPTMLRSWRRLAVAGLSRRHAA